MDEAFKDTKAGLIVIGIFEILGGLFCALIFLISALSVATLGDELPVRQSMMGFSVYGFFAVWLIWMGIGTIRARRGVRLLMLATSWIMLVCGVLAMAMMFFVLPKSFEAAEIPSDMVTPILIGMYFVLGLFYLVFPIIGILFYGNGNVKATVEHRDTTPSWTEGCPLPVLILVMMLLLGSGSLLMLSFMNFALPFWGTIISGVAGAVVLLFCVGACLLLAQGAHKLRPWAWWGTLGLLLLGLGSQMITYSRIDVMDYYRAMGYSDKMLLQLSQMDWVNTMSFSWMSIFYVAPGLIFLLFLKRYFRSE